MHHSLSEGHVSEVGLIYINTIPVAIGNPGSAELLETEVELSESLVEAHLSRSCWNILSASVLCAAGGGQAVQMSCWDTGTGTLGTCCPTVSCHQLLCSSLLAQLIKN